MSTTLYPSAPPLDIDFIVGLAVVLLALVLAGTLFFDRWARFRATGAIRWWAVMVAGGLTTLALCIFILVHHPVLGSALVILFIAGWTISFFSYGPGWWAGVRLLYLGQVRIGDDIQTDKYQGRLVGAELSRAHLLSPDGTHIYVPWSTLSGPVVVRSKRAHWPVRVQFDFRDVPSREERRRVEVRATLCPYRVWSEPVTIRSALDRPSRLDVELWSWSKEGSSLAADFLRRAVREDNSPSE